MRVDQSLIQKLAESFEVPFTDILLIALNVCGVNSDLPHQRIRFKFKPFSYHLPFYFGIPNNIAISPFRIVGDSLILDGEKMGDIFAAEDDTCDAVYLRKNNHELCFNSHSRSLCRGCKFCFGLQTPKDRETIKAKSDVDLFFENLERRYGKDFFANLSEIALVTGCFNSADRLISHLRDIYECATRRRFDGEMYYLGTEIVTREQLAAVCHMRFRYTFALETLSRRTEILRLSKANYSIGGIMKIMECANELGVITAYSYIVGLEKFCGLRKEFLAINQLLTGFPVFNIFQPHTTDAHFLRCKGADDITFYLEARRFFEEIIDNDSIVPRRWQNYRSLWYTTYKGKDLQDETI
ncbi:MAG: hypothetical protein HZA01_00015 [Nitrospinae bacterium]|nr:hypothetical protein [Nitrospinota bacterium]